jgi:N-acetylglucosamine kinase-like BadF-type ATPase
VTAYVIGVDGGNSKTEVLVVTVAGELLARVRGNGVASPLADPAGWRAHLAGLVGRACAEARVGDVRPTCAAYFLANVDLPVERRLALRELSGAAEETVVYNDTLAILHAGTARPWGVAVVAGAGINAVGVHPSGKVAGFLALGDFTGDTGGGHSLGLQALAAAVRAGDGRGAATELARAVPAHFGLRRASDVAVAIHRGRLHSNDLGGLSPVLARVATGGDPVAAGIIGAFGDEVAVMAGALIRRLRLTRTDVEVVLGGGVLQGSDAALRARIAAGVAATAPAAVVRVLDVPPVYGAAVEALRRAGADDAARETLRVALR